MKQTDLTAYNKYIRKKWIVLLVMVGLLFALADLFGEFGSHAGQRFQCVIDSLDCAGGHFGGHLMATLQSNSGSGEQTLVQLGDNFGNLIIGNQLANQLFQNAAHRQEE